MGDRPARVPSYQHIYLSMYHQPEGSFLSTYILINESCHARLTASQKATHFPHRLTIPTAPWLEAA